MTATIDDTAVSASGPAMARPPRNWTSRVGLDRFSALYLWAFFMIVFTFSSDQFLNWTSIRLVLTEKAIVGVLAMAFLIPLAEIGRAHV